jgi:hypothetical protein
VQACWCGKTLAKGLMIQCNSCTTWFHAACVSLNQVLPLLSPAMGTPNSREWCKARAKQLKIWRCDACHRKCMRSTLAAHTTDDLCQLKLTKGTVISCVPKVTAHSLTHMHT